MKPRLIDFRWYYKAWTDAGFLGYWQYGFAFKLATWLSRTFNLYLISSAPYPKHKVI